MAITKTTVTHSLISPSEDPVQRGGTISLGGFVGREWRDIQGMTADGQIITWEPADADENGEWSVQLIPNADVANPQNTLYRYLPAQGQPVVFEVKAGGPYTLAELVVTDPAQWPGLAPTAIGPRGPQGVVWRGDWSAVTAYSVGDGVSHGGSSYVCAVAITSATTPDMDTAHWGVLAIRGVGVAPGGTTGQVAVKISDADFDLGYKTLGPADVDAATAAQGALADTAVQPGSLASVAISGSYADLTGKPSIPPAQVNTDWNAITGVSQILNKPAVIAAGADQASARDAIGAGTSSLVLGTTATTAMAGNKVAADLGGITAPAVSDGITAVWDAATSAWVARPLRTEIVVTDYGATGDGVTDDTVAILAAVAAASPGGSVYFPAGTYMVSGSIVLPAGVRVHGAGMGKSIVKAIAGSVFDYVFKVSAVAFNYSVTISDIQIDGNRSQPSTTVGGIYLFAGSDCVIDRVRVTSTGGDAIRLDGDATHLGTANVVSNVWVRNGGADGVHITQYSTDTIINGCDIGSCVGSAIHAYAIHLGITGTICWGSNAGLLCEGTSGEVWVAGCRFDQNSYYGVWILCPNVTMTGCLIYDNSAILSGAHPGIIIDGGLAANTVISGCRSVGGLNGGPAQSYGLQFNGAVSAPTITSCDFTGNSISAIGGTVPADAVITDVRGYNPVGPLVTPTMPATGVAQANTFGVAATVYVSGGTVTAIAIGGVATGLTAGAFDLSPGQTIAVTYSAAPTWAWIGH